MLLMFLVVSVRATALHTASSRVAPAKSKSGFVLSDFRLSQNCWGGAVLGNKKMPRDTNENNQVLDKNSKSYLPTY